MYGENICRRNNCLDIFTDASIKQLPTREYISCSGAIVVYQDNVIDQTYFINKGSSNNNGEVIAVRQGVELAIKYRNEYHFMNINVFSDSQITIKGVRDRIFDWPFDPNNHMFLTKAGTPVANQEIYMEIVSMMISNNIHINFLHQKGHVNSYSKSLQKAEQTYNDSNGMRTRDIEFIKYISDYNTMVDLETKFRLDSIDLDKVPRQALEFNPVPFNKSRYKELVKLDRNI